MPRRGKRGPHFIIEDESFKKALREAIEESLQEFGATFKETVYKILESDCNLKKEEITARLKKFQIDLSEIFGPGAHVIEKSIVKKLYTKMGCPNNPLYGSNFIEEINDLNKVYWLYVREISGRRSKTLDN